MARPPNSLPLKTGVVGYGGAFNMGRAHFKEMAAAGMVPTAVAEVDLAQQNPRLGPALPVAYS